MGWTVRIGQGSNIRTQDRVVDVRVTEEFAHKEFTVTIQNPNDTDRAQAKGRIDDAIIEIKRGTDTLIEGFIEDVEKGHNVIRYSGRSFLVLLGYTTSSETSSDSGDTEAEYNDDNGNTIITDLIGSFCYPHDNELTYTDIDFTETYMGEVKLHGKKVYDIVRNMCIDYSKDLYADATWSGDNITAKNIHVKKKERGSSGSPHKTLYGGVHLKGIPVVKYRSSQNVINRIRVIGKGTGKDKVTAVVDDTTSQAMYGVIEGTPYVNNMIVTQETAEAIGQTIIDAKKDLVEELHTDLIQYMSDLRYGDWIRIIDSYSFVDTTQQIKKITQSYNNDRGESTSIEVGIPFDNYEMIIKDLTKGDVDPEFEMTRLDGALLLTANDPPSDYIRRSKGDYYDSTGTMQTAGKGVCTFFASDVRRLGGSNPGSGLFKKALVMIKDSDLTTWHRVGTEYATNTDAEDESISCDSGYMPLGEVILKGKGSDQVEDVYSSNQGYSYIYRDARPIVGSSSAGYGGEELWEISGDYTQLKTADDINTQYKDIINCGDIELNDGTTTSPRLNFCVPLSEEDSGMYMSYSSEDAELRWIDRESSMKLMKIDWWGDLWVHRNISQDNDTKHYFNTNGSAYIKQSTSNNLTFYDSVTGEKTLADLATNEGLWESPGEVTKLISSEQVDLYDDLRLYKNATTAPLIILETALTSGMTGAQIYASYNGLRIRKNIDDTIFMSCDFTNDVLNLANNGIYACGGIEMSNATSDIAMAGSDITGVGGITMSGNIDLNGNAIEDLTGTLETGFTIDEDNTGAGVNTALKFNRGSTAGDARLLWDETNDRFELDSVESVTLGSLRIDSAMLTGSVQLDDTTGKVKIEKNDSTGDMEFTVQSGDSFVFKVVS